MRIPAALYSIRFRLSLAFAIVVFGVGSILIGGIYLYQLNSLEQPVLNETTFAQVQLIDPETGAITNTAFTRPTDGDLLRLLLEEEQVFAYRVALNELRRASYYGLGLLFIVSFITGWLLSGWAVRPVKRITAVAQDISAHDLSRRIAAVGPNDEMRQLADTFDAMLDRLQTSFEDQRRFIHDTSHELRNPLAVARANLELGLTANDPAELTKSAEIAMRSTDRMSVLIDGLVERARQDIPQTQNYPIDLRRLAEEVVGDFGAPAAERSIQLVAVCAKDPVIVDGEPSALRRALANLLANAVRLAPESSTITVSVEATKNGASIVVCDEGPGIEQHNVPRVFDRFWRGPNAGGGSGLGLNIVQRIAERHGGTISVDSTFGKGSTFTLQLPSPSVDN